MKKQRTKVEPPMIQVTVTIDFGPTGKAGVEKVVAVPEKSTVLDALSASARVVTLPRYGMDHFVDAVEEIENDFAAERGWRFQVNGRNSNVPAERYLLKNGDWIRWSYVAGGCS